MNFIKSFPFYKQLDSTNCSSTCLRIVCKFYGKSVHPGYLTTILPSSKDGVTIDQLSEAAETLGFKVLAGKIDLKSLSKKVPLPCIIHWRNNHFVVVYKVSKNKIYVSDPAYGKIIYNNQEFINGWKSNNDTEEKGIAILLETTPRFYQNGFKIEDETKSISFGFYIQYLRPYSSYFIKLMYGLILGSLLQMVFPVLTQSIVDYGITNQNIGFVNLILIAQLMLFFSKSFIEIIRTWILLYISSKINIYIISDFLNKLMRLKMSYFDNKIIGDILQRIGDHGRVQSFISSSTIGAIFSLFSLIVYSFILAWYNSTVLLIFFIGSLIYFAWITIFLKKRKELDYKSFSRNSRNQSLLIQIISGIRDIKLNNAEKEKRWDWEDLQAESFEISVKQLKLSQMQSIGSQVIDQLKNIMISYFSAKAVINGNMTLGMMLAVQYMIGQLNGPVGQILGLFNSYQDAKISLERLSEIHDQEDETIRTKNYDVPRSNLLEFKNVNFSYNKSKEYTLRNINLTIPEGKITAIVGMSGSGKTTILKLLLQYYEIDEGEIMIGNVNLNNINRKWWRDNCGVVLQDSFIFSDTIANNIIFNKYYIDHDKFDKAVKTANISEFVDKLPLGYQTKIGSEGHGLSQGQRQRILIARAIYKAPKFIFLDEATNSLDSVNERTIMDNLSDFFENRTVIIIAHRLSTIQNADQIIVFDKGEIVEIGNHDELMKRKNYYFNLAKNQLSK